MAWGMSRYNAEVDAALDETDDEDGGSSQLGGEGEGDGGDWRIGST